MIGLFLNVIQASKNSVIEGKKLAGLVITLFWDSDKSSKIMSCRVKSASPGRQIHILYAFTRKLHLKMTIIIDRVI